MAGSDVDIAEGRAAALLLSNHEDDALELGLVGGLEVARGRGGDASGSGLRFSYGRQSHQLYNLDVRN